MSTRSIKAETERKNKITSWVMTVFFVIGIILIAVAVGLALKPVDEETGKINDKKMEETVSAIGSIGALLFIVSVLYFLGPLSVEFLQVGTF